MIGRFIILSIGMFMALESCAHAQTQDAPYNKIETTVELHGEAPYVGEPLRLVLRSAIHAQVANDRIIQPDLTNFDWQQFGVDTVNEEFIDGFWMPVLSRVLMIYPLRAGKLTIDPFKRRTTYYTPGGERTEIEIISKPVIIDVRSHDALSGPDNSWIPARNLMITDQWAPEPDNIPFEETASRTLTIEADGLTADRLPNLPSFRAPGIITFAGPVQRETIITDHGPLARAVYRWRIRPASQAVALTPPVRIRWFDVSARQMREVIVPERRVAFLASGEKRKSREQSQLSTYLSPRSIIAFLLAFFLTGAASFLFPTLQFNDMTFWRSLIGSLRLFFFLGISAWRNDNLGFYSILDQLRKKDPGTWRIIESHGEHSGLIDDLESMIYAKRPVEAPVSLLRRALTIFKIYLKARLRPIGHETTVI